MHLLSLPLYKSLDLYDEVLFPLFQSVFSFPVQENDISLLVPHFLPGGPDWPPLLRKPAARLHRAARQHRGDSAARGGLLPEGKRHRPASRSTLTSPQNPMEPEPESPVAPPYSPLTSAAASSADSFTSPGP